MTARFDLVVIGGGINGAAVARDAAGRGLSVLLAEANDYASATSSASSKLIHGGIRYLEQYEFRLVRESLHERETLMRIAPHLVYPLRFLVPVTKGQPRPAWVVRLGLILYDLLSGRKLLEKTGRLSAADAAAVPRLRSEGVRAILHYPDCWTDDARLTLETLLDARARGADIGNYRPVTKIEPAGDGYRVTFREDGRPRTVEARHVVNAGGPWANAVLGKVEGGAAPEKRLRLVRGSHIVVPMPAPKETRAFTLQNDDKRVVFVIPWLERFLIIGTTDVPHEGDPAKPKCSDAERDYLLACYRRFFDHPVTAADVVWSWSGVRPLVDDGSDNPSKVTREYELVSARQGSGGMISIYGGKITTHRKLGELVMSELQELGAEMAGPWTKTAPIHGGALDRAALARLAEDGPDVVPLEVRRRWVFTYGSATAEIYQAIRGNPALADEVAPGIPEAELLHAVTVEDAKTAEDFLYRRTKTFILLDPAGVDAVTGWFARRQRTA
ncbi:MAG: glycerol-3-phosphate dehydrogenase [Zavarzinia sp.]|nr:glycerol-3-phosphate dehydrogenase [Zavarzinia sp.]